MRIAIIGAGVVGYATGQGLEGQGHEVIYCDISSDRRAELVSRGHSTAPTVAEASRCDVYMICVPTPACDEGFDLTALRGAAADVAHVVKHDWTGTIVVRSTVLPGTMRRTVLPIVETISGRRVGDGLGLCYNPEFLRAASASEDFAHPPLTVIGEFDAASGGRLASIYGALDASVMRTSVENAEAIKCFSNAFNATKISFFNLLYLAALDLGLDPLVVSDGIVKATTGIRFPHYGTPGGRAYGGACLPKDLSACIVLLQGLGLDTSLLSAVSDMNCLVRRLESEDMLRKL